MLVTGGWNAICSTLRLLIIAKMAFHAIFLPVYEGPDEPMHLARARAAARVTDSTHPSASSVDPAVVQSIRSWPCGLSLHDAFKCPPFGGERAAFNILGQPRAAGDQTSTENYEAHQPPLYYLGVGAVLAPMDWLAQKAPERQLLVLRALAVLLVAWTLWLPVKRLGLANRDFELLLLAALFLPGASESLVRAANDIGVFAWAAGFLYLMASRPDPKPWQVALASAAGPLLKLTALPVIAYAAVAAFQNGRRRTSLLVIGCSAAIFPLQWVRGWMWGGTLEANSVSPIPDSLGTMVLGVAKSFVTLAKTAIWLGGWAGFRAPRWLLVSFALTILYLAFRCLRRRRTSGPVLPHAVAALIAAVGIVFFAIGHKKVFGVWGAVGGWYAWGWAPWLAFSLADVFELRDDHKLELALALSLAVVALNVAWYAIALSTYG